MKSEDEGTITLSNDAAAPTKIAEKLDPLVGRVIGGRFSIIEKVARGGTAVVYRALDKSLNREVAIKVLHEHLENRKEVVERFRKEALIIASLRHPNILIAHDFLDFEGRTILVVEFMPGMTLSNLVNSVQMIPEDIVLMLANEILLGLNAAHEKGIVHRDIKPANVLVHPDRGVKVSDFGLAKAVGVDEQITKEGVFVGTPSFSSPEQIEGRPIDNRSDIFSLGLTMYMLATRTHAFKNKGDSTTAVWNKTLKGSFESARERNPELSKPFEAIVNKALEINADRRYASAEAMIKDVEKLLKERRVYPYHTVLKEFLKNPHDLTKFANRSIEAKRKERLFKWTALGFIVGLVCLSSGYFAFKNMNKKSSALKSLEKIKPHPITPILVTPDPKVQKVVEAAQAEPSAPSKPAKLAVESLPVSRSQGVVRTAVDLKLKSLVVLDPEAPQPGFRFRWSEGGDFIISTNEKMESPIDQGQSFQRFWDVKSFIPGKYFWNGGIQSGELNVESFVGYRSRQQKSKRVMALTSNVEEVDLTLNPFSEEIGLSWDAGPRASQYKIELASDPNFRTVFATQILEIKNWVVQKNWEQDQIIYWRTSYLDDQKNIFFVDPVRRINLILNGRSLYDDVVFGQEEKPDAVVIKALGPDRGQWACSSISEDTTTREWIELTSDRLFFYGEIPLTPRAKWLACRHEEEDGVKYFIKNLN